MTDQFESGRDARRQLSPGTRGCRDPVCSALILVAAAGFLFIGLRWFTPWQFSLWLAFSVVVGLPGWAAMAEEFPEAREQRCWVHKTANVLDKLPQRMQPQAKKLIYEMYLAATRDDAEKAYERFIAEYGAKWPKAVDCVIKDHDVLFTFYDFPAEHWVHLRTTNPIESTFATVRHRTRQTKGCGSRLGTLTMVFKLATQAEKHCRKLNGHQLMVKVIDGVKFTNGVLETAA